jgi:GNAT superfamily N-acetyltransferase
VIRAYVANDAERCAQIIQSCVDRMPEFDQPTREYLRTKNTAQGFSFDAARMSFLIVHEDAGCVVALGGLEKGEISRLYVDPPFWRRGIGAGILRCLEAHAAEDGVTEISVRSALFSLSFYESFGYFALAEHSHSVGAATFRWIDMVKRRSQT